MTALENITYDELHVDDYATFTKSLSEEALVLYVASTEETNIQNFSVESARKAIYNDEIGYGIWVKDLISTAFSKVIPGPGSIYLEQELAFKKPVELHDTLTVKLTVIDKLKGNLTLFQCEVTNQNADFVVGGEAKVIAPTEKISVNHGSIPRVNISR